jgi:hypothetical protein
MGRKCARCGKFTMEPHGEIKGGTRGGLRDVYRCTECGYQSMLPDR